MELNIKEIAATAPNIFNGDKEYNTILAAAQLIFPKCVEHSKGYKVTIQDRVTIEMSFSGNETKIYIATYLDPKKPNNTDENIWQYHKANRRFRFFAAENVIEYLLLKKTENDYIKTYEG